MGAVLQSFYPKDVVFEAVIPMLPVPRGCSFENPKAIVYHFCERDMSTSI